MTCYKPLTAWHSRDKNPSGKRSLVFNPVRALNAKNPIQVACKQCIGCRLLRSAQWGARCVHESQLYVKDGISNNCFITLTYNEESLKARPHVWSLDVTDWQLFAKRLRKKYGNGIRFLHCGEYGENCRNCGVPESEHRGSSGSCGNYELGRPHYHAVVFNHRFDDLVRIGRRNDHDYYTSPSLSELWSDPVTKKSYGYVVVGEVSFRSAAYVARYCLKSRNGALKQSRYFDPQTVDKETGEFLLRKNEYATMSNRPGIGAAWFDRYWRDVYPHDYVETKDGLKFRPPDYYDRLLERIDPAMLEDVKARRVEAAKQSSEDLTPERLYAREQVKLSSIDKLVREL